jgi:F-type H+-transporting ATPase subunit b
MPKSAIRTLGKVLWAATIPLAVAVLLAEPTSFAQHRPRRPGMRQAPPPTPPAAEEGTEVAEHLITNPVQNLWSFGYRGLNAEGGEWQEGEHRMPPPFSMAVLNFAVFAFLLFRGAGPSLKKAVRDRHDAIAKSLAEGTRLRDEARARLDEYERKLGELQREIDIMVGGIRAEADSEKRRIIAEAEARAERMRRDAEQQIQAEMQRVRATLEREAVAAAVAIAEKLLTEKTTEADQRLLADKFVKGLQDAAGKRRTAGA